MHVSRGAQGAEGEEVIGQIKIRFKLIKLIVTSTLLIFSVMVSHKMSKNIVETTNMHPVAVCSFTLIQ